MQNVLSTVPRTLSHGKNTITKPCEIANIFNNYFASVADTAKQNINYSHTSFYASTFVYSHFSIKIQFLYCLLSSVAPWGGPMVDMKEKVF